MSGGLEALKEIDKCMVQNCNYAEYCKEFEIIEQELKEYELLKEHAERYEANNLDEMMRLIHNGWVYEREENKREKALGIIKKDFFTFIDFKEEKRESMTGEAITYYFIDFNRGAYGVYLPKEKWDLLKEILA